MPTSANRHVAAGLAGRRIDRPDEPVPRFPLHCVAAVRARIAEILSLERIGLLVSSAACGADLVALQVAATLGIRRRIVLPYNIGDFRASSVVDRPGNWGPVFDETISSVRATGDLVVLNCPVDDEKSYAQANEAIIHEVLREGMMPPSIAILVWEGRPRSGYDATATFASIARKAGLAERTVLTWGA